MNRIKFSIIIPVYNTPENFYQECIDSVNRLNYDNYEVIIVDDASNSYTKEYLKKTQS